MADFDENKGRDSENMLGFCVCMSVLGHGLVPRALGLLERKRSWKYVENIPLSQGCCSGKRRPWYLESQTKSIVMQVLKTPEGIFQNKSTS